MKRRSALVFLGQAGLVPVVLAGCGFKLRGNQNYSFQRLSVVPHPGGPLALELRRSMADAVQVLGADANIAQPHVVLEMLQEQREKSVVGVNSSGQVREFQLRIRVRFRVLTMTGNELIPESEILQQRDISFNESAALAKEAEEGLLYRNMQTDIVQQLMRRLASIK